LGNFRNLQFLNYKTIFIEQLNYAYTSSGFIPLQNKLFFDFYSHFILALSLQYTCTTSDILIDKLKNIFSARLGSEFFMIF
jgi:hypothetical protein